MIADRRGLPQWAPPVPSAPTSPPAYDLGDACITCGDIALPLTVIEVLGADARCRAEDGGEELVAIDLVGDLTPGDKVLVHAKVALERLPDDFEGTTHAFR